MARQRAAQAVDERSLHAASTALSDGPNAQRAPDRPVGGARNPFKMMFLLWGLPLILFVVVAVFKQCGS
jgi:hypothetical protein